MGHKVNQTLSIDSDVKKDFKVECTLNGVDMSETVEQLMVDYTELSRSLRNERLERNGERKEG